MQHLETSAGRYCKFQQVLATSMATSVATFVATSAFCLKVDRSFFFEKSDTEMHKKLQVHLSKSQKQDQTLCWLKSSAERFLIFWALGHLLMSGGT